MTELKPCPFCGGEAKVETFPFEDAFYVSCVGCCSCTHSFSEEKVAIEAWNRRANDEN